MKDHEIERIADAMHHLRPDWPVKQLRTLLASDKLNTRPRRDVTVALAWVACESGTANPYRVLEAGPWWKAAAIEGTATRRDVVAPEERCGVCGYDQSECTRRADHDFESLIDTRQRKSAGIDPTSEYRRARGGEGHDVDA